jgi:hypothetical protein
MKMRYWIFAVSLGFLAACTGAKKDENTQTATSENPQEQSSQAEKSVEKSLAPPVSANGTINAASVISVEQIKQLYSLHDTTDIKSSHAQNAMFGTSSFFWRKANWIEVRQKNLANQGTGDLESLDEHLQITYMKGRVMTSPAELEQEFEKAKNSINKKIERQRGDNIRNANAQTTTTELPLKEVQGVGTVALWEAEKQQLVVKSQQAVFILRSTYATNTHDDLHFATQLAQKIVATLDKKAL